MWRWTLLAVCMLACNDDFSEPGVARPDPGPGGGGVFDTFAACITFEPARLLRFTAEEPIQSLTAINECGVMDLEVSFDDPSGVFLLPEGPVYALEASGQVTFDVQFDGTPGAHEGQVLSGLRVDTELFPLGPIEMLATAE